MSTKEKPIYVEVVQGNWVNGVPDWVARLAIEADKGSLRKTAEQIGYSPAVVSQVFKNAYEGNMENVQRSVERAFGEKIDCPVLGEIDGAKCLTNQKAKYNSSNHTSVKLFIACRRCPHNMNCDKVQP